MKYNILGITLAPVGGKDSVYGKPNTMYTAVFFTNYLKKPPHGLLKMFGRPTKSLFKAYLLFIAAFIYSIFYKSIEIKL